MLRVLNRNAHYITLFRSPRDLNQIRILSTQCTPHNGLLLKAYVAATENKPHSYIHCCFGQNTPDFLRFSTNILLSEPGPVTYFLPDGMTKNYVDGEYSRFNLTIFESNEVP